MTNFDFLKSDPRFAPSTLRAPPSEREALGDFYLLFS